MSKLLNTTVIAGKQEFGVWHKNILPYVELHSFVQKWVATVIAHTKKNTKITIIDIGCGNATTTVPIIREFAKTEKQIEYLLLEPQLDALKEASNTIQKSKLASNVMCNYYEQNVEKMKIAEKVDGISCFFVLHFLPPSKMLRAVQNMYSLLKPGGFLVIAVPSIYDRKFLEVGENSTESEITTKKLKQRMSVIQKLTNHGSSNKIFKGKKGFKHVMYFFTQPALEKLVTTAGFLVHKVIWEKEKNHSNRLPKKYMEILAVVVEKTS